VGVHFAGEHARQLELAHALAEAAGIALDFRESGFVLLGLDQLEQFRRVGKAAADAVQLAEGLVEPRALAAERLRLVRRVPDGGVRELAVQLLETLALAVVLKGTPSAPRGAGAGHRASGG
jgi:hypothetical protein